MLLVLDVEFQLADGVAVDGFVLAGEGLCL